MNPVRAALWGCADSEAFIYDLRFTIYAGGGSRGNRLVNRKSLQRQVRVRHLAQARQKTALEEQLRPGAAVGVKVPIDLHRRDQDRD